MSGGFEGRCQALQPGHNNISYYERRVSEKFCKQNGIVPILSIKVYARARKLVARQRLCTIILLRTLYDYEFWPWRILL